jgi:transcriptional regulator with XRE-family HTH domain
MGPTAAQLLRGARQRAGLSQAELARRAGLPRSVLNAYERGKRQPGADVLVRIVRAAGLDLRLDAAPERPDPARAARILTQVLDLAETLPSRRRRGMFPPFLERSRA